jgi:hypothetical protein
MAQGIVRKEPLVGVPGKDFDGSGRINTYINSDPKAKQIVDVLIGSAVAGEKYFVTVSGVSASYTAQPGDGVSDIADGLETAINNEPLLAGLLLAESDGVDTVTLTALYGGSGYSVTDLATGLSVSIVQANATADPVPFGRLVVTVDGDGRDQLCRLAKAIALAKQSAKFEASEGIDGELIRLTVSYNGELFTAEHVFASGQTADDVADGLEAAFNLLSLNATATADGNELEISVDVAGDKFEIVSFGAALELIEQNAGDDLNDVAAGITLQSYNVPNGIYAGGRPVSVKDDQGRVFVETEDSASLHKKVYVRLEADGNLDKIGGFRATPAPGCVLLKKAKWHRVADATLAVVEF